MPFHALLITVAVEEIVKINKATKVLFVKKFSLAKTFGLTTALVLGASLSAMATVTMTFTWSGTYYEAGYNAQYINGNDAIGIYAFSVQPNSDGVPSPLYNSVCLSPAGLLDGGTYTYDIKQFSLASPGIYPGNWAHGNGQQWGINNVAYLWSTYGMDIVNNTGSIGNQNQRAAALEFAVWTALYNSTGYGQLGPNNWVAPTLQMDAITLGYYNSYITALTSPSGPHQAISTGNILEGTGAVAGGAGSGQSQEFLLLGTAVPEPTTMVVGALLLLPFGASTLRMFRRNRTA